eukprot:6016840-Alexandrium_andersonii.AAC.1
MAPRSTLGSSQPAPPLAQASLEEPTLAARRPRDAEPPVLAPAAEASDGPPSQRPRLLTASPPE